MLLLVLGFALLVLMFLLLTLEVLHRTIVAFLLAGIVFALNITLRFTSFEDLLAGIDLNTILLLMSMMIVVGALSRTGFFEYVAEKLLYRTRRRPWVLVASLASITALISAFVDNVTTVLLMAPVVIGMCRELDVDPRPVLLATVFASNIGGTATLIGDPPNIIIGSAARLGFNDFIQHLTPIAAVDVLALVLLCPLMFRSWFREYRARVREVEVRGGAPLDRSLLRKVLATLAIVISLFALEDALGYPPSVPAVMGAAITLVLVRDRVSVDDVMSFIDWPTLVFFVFMFVAIRGIERMGVMDFVAKSIAFLAPSPHLALMAILWISALLSAFVDNIPFVMAMVTVVPRLATSLGIDATPLYWALSLGGCLGGNGTLVGASANVVVAGIAEKHGYSMHFRWFMRFGIPTTLLTVGLAALYLLARYG